MAFRLLRPALFVLLVVSLLSVCNKATAQGIYVAVPGRVYVRAYAPPYVAYPYAPPYNPRRAYRQAVRSNYYAAAAAATYAVPPSTYSSRYPRIAPAQPSTDYGTTAGPRDYLYNPPANAPAPTPAPPRASTVNPPSNVLPSTNALKPLAPQPGTEAIPAPPSEPGPVEF